MTQIPSIISTDGRRYFKIKISDCYRNVGIVRGSTASGGDDVCKELTEHSLPEIGDAFGGA
jgi:ATPase involved in DNA replication initiation